MQSGLNRSDISLNFEMSWEICQFLDCLVKETLIWCVCKYVYFLQADLLTSRNVYIIVSNAKKK